MGLTSVCCTGLESVSELYLTCRKSPPGSSRRCSEVCEKDRPLWQKYRRVGAGHCPCVTSDLCVSLYANLEALGLEPKWLESRWQTGTNTMPGS